MLTSGVTDNLTRVYFSDAKKGIAIGWNGTIIRTTDGGTTWTKQTSGTTWTIFTSGSGTTKTLKHIAFSDSLTGVAVGWTGTILTTVDGGRKWTKQTSGTSNDLNCVVCRDAKIYTVVGSTGVVLQTTDGGITWTPQSASTQSALQNVFFADKNFGCIVGFGGAVLLTGNGGTTKVSGTSALVPAVTELDQNYPNPFNPTTEIGYAIAAAGRVSLKVFDVLGNERRVLVDENRQPGTYKATFSATDLPSGVYFFTLRTDNFTQTKKMLMVR